MSRKIYIGEDNLINLKNAMAGKNIGHSTFMQEDKPPYEKDEFTINPEGGANDNFHVNENASKELINTAIKYRPNEFSRWAVVIPSNPSLMPNYFEKKSLAIEFKKWHGNCFIIDLDKYDKLNENIENEVEANEVNLDSFKKQKELAPKIWNGDKLNSRARLKLLDIADDFWETTDIGWVKPKGIVLMGSICNYNWSKSSDIDLHLQVDFSEVDEKKDFVQEYFNGKKNEWNEEHSNLNIFGFPVELYVEDIDADTNSGGIYDLEENDWIKKPSKDGIKQIGLDKYSIKDKSAKIMTDIDDLYGLFKKTDDDAKLRKIGEKAHDLLGKIKAMRKDGLSRGGESDKDNIVYKVLRRTGYMDILWNLSSQLYDKLNSIDESNILEIAERYIRASLLNEEVVADGNAGHNPFKKRWKYERETLINYLTNYGEIMTSKENGKQYKVLFDDTLSSRIGLNYCLCIQWNPMTMEPGNVIYVRALDKFTRKIFKPEFDTRGFDNIAGTSDDVKL